MIGKTDLEGTSSMSAVRVLCTCLISNVQICQSAGMEEFYLLEERLTTYASSPNLPANE